MLKDLWQDPLLLGQLRDLWQDPLLLGQLRDLWQDPLLLGRLKDLWQDPLLLGRLEDLWQDPLLLGWLKDLWQDPLHYVGSLNGIAFNHAALRSLPCCRLRRLRSALDRCRCSLAPISSSSSCACGIEGFGEVLGNGALLVATGFGAEEVDGV